MLGDVKKLLAAISPSIRPVLIANATQAASLGVLAQSPLPVITAPYLAADQIIAVDAAAFASALGQPDFNISEEPVVHMENTAPLPIVGGTCTAAGYRFDCRADAKPLANRGPRLAHVARLRLDDAPHRRGGNHHRRDVVTAMSDIINRESSRT